MLTTMLVMSALAAPTRAALGTTVTLPRKVLEPGEPAMLYLAMENRTDQRLYFEDHDLGACFVAKYAKVTMEPAATPLPMPECKPKNRAVMPGEVVDFVVNLHEIYDLSGERYNIKVEWRDGGPDIYSPTTAAVGPIRMATPVYKDRLKKGDTLFLPNKNALVFDRHEWKPAARKGEPASLVVHFTHQVRGEGEFEKSITFQTDKSHQVRFDGLLFDMGMFQFDQWMDLRIYQGV
jgi:hypothetical protein